MQVVVAGHSRTSRVAHVADYRATGDMLSFAEPFRIPIQVCVVVPSAAVTIQQIQTITAAFALVQFAHSPICQRKHGSSARRADLDSRGDHTE